MVCEWLGTCVLRHLRTLRHTYFLLSELHVGWGMPSNLQSVLKSPLPFTLDEFSNLPQYMCEVSCQPWIMEQLSGPLCFFHFQSTPLNFWPVHTHLELGLQPRIGKTMWVFTSISQSYIPVLVQSTTSECKTTSSYLPSPLKLLLFSPTKLMREME